MFMARVRAVENRRWLLRDTNNGYTESIDPYGRTAAQLAIDIRGQLSAPYDFRSDLTPYARFGDWFSWLCILATFVLLGFALVKPGAQQVIEPAGSVKKKSVKRERSPAV